MNRNYPVELELKSNKISPKLYRHETATLEMQNKWWLKRRLGLESRRESWAAVSVTGCRHTRTLWAINESTRRNEWVSAQTIVFRIPSTGLGPDSQRIRTRSSFISAHHRINLNGFLKNLIYHFKKNYLKVIVWTRINHQVKSSGIRNLIANPGRDKDT